MRARQVAGSGASSAAAAKVAVPTFRIFGDSVASQNDSAHHCATADTTMACTKYPYWFNLLDWLTGGQINNQTMISCRDNLRYGSNSGRGGADMGDVLTVTPSLDTILATMPESHMIVVLGTNSINASNVTLANINAQWEVINNKILGAGKTPIWTTVLPRNGVDGANDWSATTITAAQRRLIVAAHNKYRVRRCRELGIICVDWHNAYANAAGSAVTGYSVDGLHPDFTGSWEIAKVMYDAIGHLIPHAGSHRSVLDVETATYDPYGNKLNGALTGTGGASSNGSGTGVITGTIPDNFQLAKSTSTSTNCFAEIVPRTDGMPGNVLQLTFTTDGAGAASENWRLNYWTGASTTLGSWANTGDYVQMACEIEFLSGHGGAFLTAGPRIGMNAATANSAKTTISFDTTDNSINDSGGGFGSFVNNRVVCVSGAAQAGNNTVFKVLTATANKLVCDTSTPVTAESAGNSITVTIPSSSTIAYGSSTTRAPDDNSPVLFMRTPVMEIPVGGNVSPRIDIFIKGTVAGTVVVRIANPELFKVETLPSVLSFQAND